MVLVGYCLAAFLPALLVRRYGLPLAEVGLITGVVAGAGGAIGTIAGGLVGDRWGDGIPRRLAYVTALAVLPAPLLIAGGILSHALAWAVAGSTLGMIAIYAYVAPAFAQVHALSNSGNRATVTSIYYLITNLIGLGIGPPLVGAISDFSARRALGLDATQFAQACLRPGPPLSACPAALADGMEAALLAISMLPLLAAAHFLLGARRYSMPSA